MRDPVGASLVNLRLCGTFAALQILSVRNKRENRVLPVGRNPLRVRYRFLVEAFSFCVIPFCRRLASQVDIADSRIIEGKLIQERLSEHGQGDDPDYEENDKDRNGDRHIDSHVAIYRSGCR